MAATLEFSGKLEVVEDAKDSLNNSHGFSGEDSVDSTKAIPAEGEDVRGSSTTPRSLLMRSALYRRL